MEEKKIFEKEEKIKCKRKELINSLSYSRHIRKFEEIGKMNGWWEVTENKVDRKDL